MTKNEITEMIWNNYKGDMNYWDYICSDEFKKVYNQKVDELNGIEYLILDANMERLKKKLTRIQNKCKQYNCDFNYEQFGEEIREIENPKYDSNHVLEPKTIKTKFIRIKVKGKAKINNWEFVAQIEHTDKGNIITGTGTEVPHRFYNCDPYCEHCKSNRYRKETYIVRNTETNEFKQVGSNCLFDYTNGMDAEYAASYISAFTELIEGETPMSGSTVDKWYDLKKYLLFVTETVKHFGYVKSHNSYDEYDDDDRTPTKNQAWDFMEVKDGIYPTIFDGGRRKRELEDLMLSVNFNVDSEENNNTVDSCIDYVLKSTEDNNYFNNLKVLCKLGSFTNDKMGIICSMIPVYLRHIEKLKEIDNKKKLKLSLKESSCHLGNVGNKISVKIKECRCLASRETQFGISYFYQFIDENGNVLIWSTNKSINEEYAVDKNITGTIKELKEYNEIKQTVLTRCKMK